MGLLDTIKENILNRSDMYNFYVNETKKLRTKNKRLKNSNNSLKKELNNSKIQSSNKDKLIKSLINDNEEFSKEMYNYCPLCDEVIKFKPFGIIPRDNAFCPSCESLERHRFFYLALNSKFPNIFNKNSKVLHFAPEKPLYNKFKSIDNIDYVTVDIDPETYEKRNIHITKKMNMENIEYDDETFDIVYNSHVLEHVPDDIKAMGELYRVLKNDGICFIAVPLYDIPETLEKEEYNTPELRLKYYGQEDHLRKYGLDFKDRLISVGFNVEQVMPENLIENSFKRKVYGLGEDKLFICRKNH